MLPGTPRWLASRVFNPASLALVWPDLRGLRQSVSQIIDGLNPDLIWAEEAFAVLLSPAGTPIVHSHHDFHFKLRSVRDRSVHTKRFRRPQALSVKRSRELEVNVCRRSAHTICASRSEAEFLQELGISASYVPVTGPAIPAPDYSALEERQKQQTRQGRARRDEVAWRRAIDALEVAARGTDPLMPPILAAVRARATVGEVSDTLRGVWGVFRPHT